jgi:hypothetical protein
MRAQELEGVGVGRRREGHHMPRQQRRIVGLDAVRKRAQWVHEIGPPPESAAGRHRLPALPLAGR